MFENLEKKELYGLIGGFVVVIVISFAAGSLIGGMNGNSSPQDQEIQPISTDEAAEEVQSVMDLQLEGQRQQLDMIANQSENITTDDVSIAYSINNVTDSKFESLYKVNAVLEGTVPTQTGELQDINQPQELYVSKDGKYLFQSPMSIDQIKSQYQLS